MSKAKLCCIGWLASHRPLTRCRCWSLNVLYLGGEAAENFAGSFINAQ
jgi:hypothetical protein